MAHSASTLSGRGVFIGEAACPNGSQWDNRTAKQLPEVSRTAVWGRAALCLAWAQKSKTSQ